MTATDFSEIYRLNSVGIYRFALHMSGSESVAEDVSQETFLMLMNKPKSYDPDKGQISSFLYGVARNIVKRNLERGCKQSYLEDCTEEPQCPDNDPLGDLTDEQSLQALRDAVASLPPRYREVIVLCDLQELSYQSAASTIGCAIGTLRSRLHRARRF